MLLPEQRCLASPDVLMHIRRHTAPLLLSQLMALPWLQMLQMHSQLTQVRHSAHLTSPLSMLLPLTVFLVTRAQVAPRLI